MPLARYEIDGRSWIPIAAAAKLLRTNAAGVRKLMGDGTVDWRQTQANSRTFVVDEAAVMALRQARPGTKLALSPDPLASKPKPKPARRAIGVWDAHHLRLTLPRSDTADST